MTQELFDTPPPERRPTLPEPGRERWQPLRLGLIELFHYDSEEFWFHDGHLLLRGNNGTGKSKVLSLTLPLLFDAQLRPARVEPDGDAGKKMAWNLLLGTYPRRIGYSWIEFGRRERDGQARYLTLGVGLSAVAGRAQVESWYFLLEGNGHGDDPRIGQDIWLTTSQRQVLTRDRLRDMLAGRGQIFEGNTQGYRRAVDERLFHLGPRRYNALMDTLIQLRQPQLSRKPDEAGLSNALSESLPPLPIELLGDVAEALSQLEEDRDRLEETRRLEQAVNQFEKRYRGYAGILARRQARELRQAQTAFDYASEARNTALAEQQCRNEETHTAQHTLEAARQEYIVARERLETLQSDPANQDANRLSIAEADARQREQEALIASSRRNDARGRLQREADLARQRAAQADQAREALIHSRQLAKHAAMNAGLDTQLDNIALFDADLEELANDDNALPKGTALLRELVTQRRQGIGHLRRLHVELTRQQATRDAARETWRQTRDELDDALARREEADLHVEAVGEQLLEAWNHHCGGLQQLRLDNDTPLQLLPEWISRPSGENPVRVALAHVRDEGGQRQAIARADIEQRRRALHTQRHELQAEQARLQQGEDTTPPPPATRSPESRERRQGAPLWRLIDFSPDLPHDSRAGLEAALQASGLLDAWLSPDGSLQDSEGRPWIDTSWALRAPFNGTSLASALVPVLPENASVREGLVKRVLSSVAFGPDDAPHAEVWLSPEGRFRLGTLAGAWNKDEAVFIGHAARENARRQRLAAIEQALSELAGHDASLDNELAALNAAREQAEKEWQTAPSDTPLHDAITAATLKGSEAIRAQQRLEQAETRVRDADGALQEASRKLQLDAADLRLPAGADELPAAEHALDNFDQAQTRLQQAAHIWQRVLPEHEQQQQRARDASLALEDAEAMLIQAEQHATKARATFSALQESVGRQVEELRIKMHQVRQQRDDTELAVTHAQETLANARTSQALANERANEAERRLTERTTLRTQAIERLQVFARSGLLASALPDAELPALWGVEAALTLARRMEQALHQVNDDDAAWSRVQKQLAEDLNELQRSLGALGHQAVSEPNDFGLTVTIQFQNRAERPDQLARLLADDIAQRSELLSAREREVLENHLQAEIATEIQRLIRAAADRVSAINEELYKRPTTTGVRYRLQWEPLTVEEGAPTGLEEARKRLLNTSPDLWTADDRSIVGVMLQQQIAGERARADAQGSGTSLIDQLAHALDYRHWHRFRIQRHQDGQWRKLSGPASSGERALGLTVPLFAAIASFYGHGGNPLAPRLMLLDEAFAGIDDAARAHCMGLVREFDLDFVITSEREWACYATLPGVAICQLQRREGIDAVFVSRWVWDGQARRQTADPDRRFPEA